MSSGLCVLVLGYVVRYPLGGMIWSNLHYLMGLQRLGHQVWYLEDSDDYASCYDPLRFVTDTNPTYGLEFARKVFESIGFRDRWAFHDAHTRSWLGPVGHRVLELCRDADIVLNLACSNPLRPWLEDVPVRAYVDEDPGFTQVRRLTDPVLRERADGHNIFLSFAENIERGTARLPVDGIRWRATRQPVVTEVIRTTPGPSDGKLTTVMQWKSYEPVEYNGVKYGVKAESFPPFMSLPQRLGRIFELALGSPEAPGTMMRQKGWLLRDPIEASINPWTYEAFIRESKAEFGIAKQGYVISHSGWFSERSCCYLALGRPVLAQDTGFSEWLETGEGVLPFSTPDDVAAAIDELDTRYQAHCRAARDLVEEYFNYRKVLPRLIEESLNPGRLPEAILGYQREKSRPAQAKL